MVTIHNPQFDDYLKMHRLVGRIDGLVQHPAHVYKIMCDHFGDSIFLASQKEPPQTDPVGLMLGIVSRSMHGLLFVWQIGVEKQVQGMGVGSQLLQRTIEYGRDAGLPGVMATVETTNTNSQRLFEKNGFEIATEKYQDEYTRISKSTGKPALENYYGSGTDQIFYEFLFGQT
ncbi:MAG: GNAT family N-acetyltransferase [Bacteroidales bacterium]